MNSPNAIGWLMFLIWPILALIYKKKLDPPKLVAFLFIFPYLFFPVKTGIDPPVLPPFDKTSIAAMIAMAVCFFHKQIKLELLPQDAMSRRMIILLLLFPIFTVLTNDSGYVVGPRALPGLGVSDIINLTFFNVTEIYVPFILAYSVYRSKESIESMLALFVGFTLFYSLFVLWEVRMSPQLHAQIYGFFPHSFGQMMRQGGFRAVVFLGHGLLTSILLGMGIVGVFALRRYGREKIGRFKTLHVGIFLIIILVLNKSLASLLFTLFFVSLILFVPRGAHLKIYVAISLIILAFPLIRSEYIPLDVIVEKFEEYSADRAQSLEFRIDNEDRLIERAYDKSIFGWGSYGRNLLYNPKDGARAATSDSYWVILFGQYGFAGYFVVFGMIVFPIMRLSRAYRHIHAGEQYGILLVLAGVLMVNFVDQLLNDSINQITFLLSGALVGGLVSKNSKSTVESS